MPDRISSLDDGYLTGDLSVFPIGLDTKEILFEATNNSIVCLKQSLTYTGKTIIVEDTSGFPDSGILRVGPPAGVPGQHEMVYYGKRTKNTFQELKRGHAGSRQGTWPSNTTFVSNSVSSEHHNAIKDATINIEIDLGTLKNPDPESLNGILKQQEVRFLAPKPLFRAFPVKGPPPLKVRFQNFSTGHIVRYLWDFGDGGTSLEKSPIHTYVTEGKYTVKLNVITSTGAQGIATKKGYIEVNSDESIPFFYVDSVSDPYSMKTSAKNGLDVKEFIFVDQTDGDIVQINWIFGYGITFTQEDPDIHNVTHIYQEPGEYIVSELIQFSNGRLKRVELPELLVVL